jgi:hypothetical protein
LATGRVNHPATPCRPSLFDRFRDAVVKPAATGAVPGTGANCSRAPGELEAATRSADDKERLVGLIAAPLAAAIGILVVGALVANDPVALLKSGLPNTAHVSLSIYEGLEVVLVALSVLMLGTALWRKRLLLGIVMALYGLAVFNLHYWGFGSPFILAGAWLLVRAYRLQKEMQAATGEPSRTIGVMPVLARAQANKRHTPPATYRKR